MVFLLGGWILRKALLASAAGPVLIAYEKELGEEAFTQVREEYTFITDASLTSELEKITDPLLAGIDEDASAFEFHIVQDETVNAFAIPGGKVCIFTGLLTAADTPEEVAGVLAHEIAHVTCQHSMEMLIENIGLFSLIQCFFGDDSGVGHALMAGSAFLLTRKFSRDHEREADEVGFEYLVAAGINPAGLVIFFEKLEREQRQYEMGDSESVFSTHPLAKERVQTLREMLAEVAQDHTFTRMTMDYKAFKAALEEKLEE